ncbi:caspase family protein [Nonomuraea sp. K274]|uniref:Caspase family protein n=1 Tax=Nonomuraea cypriaca TaxID=1187855 RepID=A0A931A3K5_9ACTN|nr:YDG/SRA domain-containing protein [Nonomuraea cypriaca]MBF8185566.1 caspase family protein [Nonomuraea cypriaca]
MTKPPNTLKSRAVLIGTSSYLQMAALPAVENNLKALQELLEDGALWGLPPTHCTVVRDPELATDMLDPVREAAAAAEDTLVVYFSGHGLLDDSGELYLTLPESDRDRMYTSVRYAYLKDQLLDSRARHKVVILDCCYSGRALGAMGADDEVRLADSAAMSGTYVMAAANDTARVVGEYSAFSGELISLIRNGIPDQGAMLTVDVLFKTVREALHNKGLPIPQKRERDFGADLPLFYNKAYQQPSKEHYGPVANVEPSRLFATRRELHDEGIHRPLQAGICGTAERGGAESIVVSGGYKDDRDYGNVIIYTGHGGRDPNTGEQVADQSPTDSGNAALIKSIITEIPVRVVRGSGGNPEFSPEYGYSYDGLFRVTDYWTKPGVDGPTVLQFRLEKTVDSGVRRSVDVTGRGVDLGRWSKVSTETYADIAIADSLKRLYEYSCQVCNFTVEVPGGLRIAVAVHIKGLNLPHNGPDAHDNMLCLCLNHADLFRYGAIVIDESFQVINQIDGEPIGDLIVKHEISKDYLGYHRQHHLMDAHL